MQPGKPFIASSEGEAGAQNLQAIVTALQNLVTAVNGLNTQLTTALANLANPAGA